MTDAEGIDRKELRRMAREAADKGEAPDVSGLSDEQVSGLIYEFGVYQSELLASNEELRELRQELETERDKYHELYHLAPVGYLTLDSAGRVREANLTICAMLGKTRQEILGTKFEKFFIAEDVSLLREHLASLIVDEAPGSVELQVLHEEDEDLTHLRLESRPLKQKNGEEAAFLLAAVDVSERLRLERDLKNAKLAAEAANKAKSEFLANMSHEIRTPMTGVLGMLRLLDQSELAEKQRDYVNTARQAAEGLMSIINDILDLSKIEAGKLSIEERAFDPAQEIETVAELFRRQAEEKGLELRAEIDQNMPEFLLGDPARIRQILFNLVGNSLKFTERGAIRVKAANSGVHRDGSHRVNFSVADTGCGMSRHVRERVFQPFEQAESDFSMKIAGTGLGLSIVKRLTDLMHGTLSLRSKKGEGTTITFTLPLREATPDEVIRDFSEGFADGKTRAREEEQRGYRILLAEDNVVNQMAAKEFLTGYGHEVVPAMNGREALKALEQGGFDAVLMDVQMPEMDGLEATRRIRDGATKSETDIPVIALTAYAMNEDKRRIMDAGVDAHLSKPYDFKELDSLIRRVIRERKGKTNPSR